jgi:hypothetical protein
MAEPVRPLKWDKEHTDDVAELLRTMAGMVYANRLDARVCKQCRKGRWGCCCDWRTP